MKATLQERSICRGLGLMRPRALLPWLKSSKPCDQRNRYKAKRDLAACCFRQRARGCRPFAQARHQEIAITDCQAYHCQAHGNLEPPQKLVTHAQVGRHAFENPERGNQTRYEYQSDPEMPFPRIADEHGSDFGLVQSGQEPQHVGQGPIGANLRLDEQNPDVIHREDAKQCFRRSRLAKTDIEDQ